MAKKNDETEVKEQDMQETAKTNVQQVMYVGPSVPRLGLVQNRVYIGDVDDVFAPIKEKYPLVMQLVVPVEDSMRARADVNTPGTACYMAAQQIAGGEG
nr:MAG TPA: hypothetical protein [Caudoviricetes sp.]